jgi:hypothetical protein
VTGPEPRICAHCGRVIDGPADTFVPDAPTGVQPALHFHPGCYSRDSWWAPARARYRR